ncbi:uncharacterized protein LOC132623621 isoform X1 [Lycium barbarum]|uniref:uncharacterized protein LOC132623621 isoform X1 n=1 Tax=Lycium barbarum TaxID=112863 RepID=UPI00293F568C|nr:uncharacterized protein LOC132623621 isoform X1 [Lycium barbarum]
MEEIEHKYIEVNGLKLHIAETGSGHSPVVVFLHGFPGIWYSWRYQMIAVAKAGYRAIAPDFRGYGLSDQPPQPKKTTFLDLISDLLALLDVLSISKAFLVAKDFGIFVLSRFVVFHGERVSGFITMGVPFYSPLTLNLQGLPEGSHLARWREPGRAEADFGRFDAKTVVKNVYILFSGTELVPIASENQEIMDLVQPSTPLPPWFSEEDLAIYGALYENSGFQTALQVPYRALHEEVNITDPRVNVPALFIVGEDECFLKFPGMEEYTSGGILKSLVPNSQMVFLPEGTHFVQEQLPEEVNQLVLGFLAKYSN